MEVQLKTGLLWFDNSPQRELADKVLRAAAHYQTKYGHAPTVCFVHPAMLEGNGGGMLRAGQVEVRPGRAIMRDHFWLGVADEQEPRPAARHKTQAVATP